MNSTELIERLWARSRDDQNSDWALMRNAADALEAQGRRLAEAVAERDSIRTMLLNERAEWMDEAIRRQASVNANLAALVIDAQEELRKCQRDAIQLQDRLAEAEARIRNALDALNDNDSAGAHLILYEWSRKHPAMEGGE